VAKTLNAPAPSLVLGGRGAVWYIRRSRLRLRDAKRRACDRRMGDGGYVRAALSAAKDLNAHLIPWAGRNNTYKRFVRVCEAEREGLLACLTTWKE